MAAQVPAEVVKLMAKVVSEIINPIIGVLFALALVYFLYGLTVFIINAGEVSKRAEGRSHMFWGLIGLFVMVSAWALIQMGLNTFGL